jgi:hypothetical protein
MPGFLFCDREVDRVAVADEHPDVAAAPAGRGEQLIIVIGDHITEGEVQELDVSGCAGKQLSPIGPVIAGELLDDLAWGVLPGRVVVGCLVGPELLFGNTEGVGYAPAVPRVWGAGAAEPSLCGLDIDPHLDGEVVDLKTGVSEGLFELLVGQRNIRPANRVVTARNSTNVPKCREPSRGASLNVPKCPKTSRETSLNVVETSQEGVQGLGHANHTRTYTYTRGCPSWVDS